MAGDQEQLFADLRKAAGSRMKLAMIAGVSISTAQAWEKDGSAPDGRPLARLLRAFPARAERILEVLAADPSEEETAAATEPVDEAVAGPAGGPPPLAVGPPGAPAQPQRGGPGGKRGT